MCAAVKGEKIKAEGIEDNPITFAKQIFPPSLMDFITLVISSDLSDFIVWSFCDTPRPPYGLYLFSVICGKDTP